MPKLLFTKQLSKTDIEHRMAVPLDSLDAFQIPEGAHFKEFGVTDIHGKRWRFRCRSRKTDLHPKPVLSSGWMEFVKRRALREGDEVTFFVMDMKGAEDLELGIQARKRVKLFDQVLWSEPL